MKLAILTTTLFLLCCIANSAFSQPKSDTASTSKYVYCELVGIPKLLSLKVNVSVDYGDERYLFKDTRMRDEQTGKLTSFNSMVDALNYMGSKDWEFVQAYVVFNGSTNVYRWLLKKKKDL
jgi:hypothetical protein